MQNKQTKIRYEKRNLGTVVHCDFDGLCWEDEMDAVIEKGLSVSVEQSKLMAKSIWEQKTLLPRTLDKEGKLITFRLGSGGPVAFFQEYSGICMRQRVILF